MHVKINTVAYHLSGTNDTESLHLRCRISSRTGTEIPGSGCKLKSLSSRKYTCHDRCSFLADSAQLTVRIVFFVLF